MKNDCPICLEHLESPGLGKIYLLKCGHALHSNCKNEYLKSGKNIGCPVCKKSIYKIESLEKDFDLRFAMMPMPLEYQNIKVNILCNDCLKKSIAPFHVLGAKC